MPDHEEVAMQLLRLGSVSKSLGKREIKALPSVLWEHETLTGAVQGMYQSNIGMLVSTDKRLIFLDKRFFGGMTVEDFPYENITSIQYETGLIMGKIRIFASGNRAEISSIPKNLVQNFAENIRQRITGGRYHKGSSTTPSVQPAAAIGAGPAVTDLVTRIERLSELKSLGVLSDDEFSAAKAKLIAE